MTLDTTLTLTVLFGALFLLGTLFCLPLYHWHVRAFIHSDIWTKIVWWIPIFIVFIGVLYGGALAAVVAASVLLIQGIREFCRNHGQRSKYAQIYFAGFLFATAHLGVIFQMLGYSQAVTVLIVVCFASVLSDVCAFFCGNYFGKTPLPSWINARKSWEGVGGQIVGAVLGYALVFFTLDIPHMWLFAAGIGIASATGDLANSTAKRSLRIKDWGQTIPGHGGVLDRFSSLSAAIAFAVWAQTVLA